MPADMVMKAARAGVPLLASKTYPTDGGIALARRARLTLATLRPDGSLLIWTDGTPG
jgi:FdhD protein